MSSFFSNCTAVPDCPVDTQAQCDQIKLSGVFNCTDIKHDTNPATLYCWRLAVENCTNDVICNLKLNLDPEWKFTSAVGDSAATIFQPFFSRVLHALEIETNIPGASVSTNWNGDDETQIFNTLVDLPAGRWVIEVCVEVSKAAINVIAPDCYEPSLMPSLLDASFTNASNTGCPVTVTGIVGCNPDNAVAFE